MAMVGVITALITASAMNSWSGSNLKDHVMVEGHNVTKVRVDNIEDDITEIKRSVGAIEDQMVQVRVDVKQMNTGLEANRELKEKIMNKLDRIDSHIGN
tara:strand:- start:13782 stop:14078 length:297 start_codon:yes stop_codon:yes gene_type:complete